MNAPYLRLLGSPSVEGGDGNTLSGRVTQRHRLALLALLALAPEYRLTRDKLIGYLWPDSDGERARNLLNVALYNLRKALGDGAILSNGDDLTLNQQLIPTDIADFNSAVERSDHIAAVSFYRGAFLDGFFLKEAPEFEQWADRVRARLGATYDKSLEALAEGAESTRDYATAADWWKARAARDPYDSRVALRLMHALAAAGNRAAAMQQASLHQRLVKAEFGVESVPVAVFAERLRTEPVSPELPAPALPEAPGSVITIATGGTPAGARSAAPASVTRRQRQVFALLAFGALAALVWTFWGGDRGSRAEGSIAVLPFVNLSANSETEFFSDGLTEEIITRLAAIPGLKVISRTSVMRYKRSKTSLKEIANALNVAHILEGSVRESEGALRISAQLVDAKSDAHLWANTYEHKQREPFRVQEEIAREVARALELELGQRTRRLLVRRGTSDREAYELCQRGRFFWDRRTREGHRQALEYFERAIARDSNYAEAYAGIANVYLTDWQLNLSNRSESEAYSHLRRAAERAIALDGESADAHVSFAIALWWQKDWPSANRELRRAIELNPNHATAHTWHGLLLRGMGRAQEARRQGRRAYELDPFAPVTATNYGFQCLQDRDYDCAVRLLRGAIAAGPYPGAWRLMALAYTLLGQSDSALLAIQRSIDMAPERPGILGLLAYVQARAGRTDEARVTLRRAKREPLEPFDIGRAHVAFGEADSAFVWLERAHWQWPHRAVLSDPSLDPVRSDPRFARLTARVTHEMGLE
jgi:TolB-like protein/DNA-binding SARP family transcriptional activator/Flp pilus assembly protein TadD